MTDPDFLSLFDEVLSEYPEGVPMTTDKRAPFHYVFALDAALNTGNLEPLDALLRDCITPPRACLPFLADTMARIKPPTKDPYPESKAVGRPKGGLGRPRKSKLTNYQRFVAVITMASREARQISGYAEAVSELAKRFAVSESTIREVWDHRNKYFPNLTF